MHENAPSRPTFWKNTSFEANASLLSLDFGSTTCGKGFGGTIAIHREQEKAAWRLRSLLFRRERSRVEDYRRKPGRQALRQCERGSRAGGYASWHAEWRSKEQYYIIDNIKLNRLGCTLYIFNVVVSPSGNETYFTFHAVDSNGVDICSHQIPV